MFVKEMHTKFDVIVRHPFQHELKRVINFNFDHGDVSLTPDRKVLEKQMLETMSIASGNLIISHERVLSNTRQPLWCPIIWMNLEEEYIEMLGQDKTYKCEFIYILYEIQWHWLIEWSSFIRCAIFMNLTLLYTMKQVFNIAFKTSYICNKRTFWIKPSITQWLWCHFGWCFHMK